LSGKVENDLLFAEAVFSGDAEACERFVNDYTDIVLSRVWFLRKTHCHYPARERTCSLLILLKRKRGTPHLADLPGDHCDECLDSYLWFFDFLKKKLKAYKGAAGCSLRTFVVSVLNSPYTYKDWLRWLYGRADRAPAAIKALDRTSRDIYLHLAAGKSKEDIIINPATK
jgi:hypothetical protein